MRNDANAVYDCIVIGGGIGGLTAGIYLARFGYHIKIIDNDNSRAKIIPCSHNFPAFPNGISGKDILDRMKKQYLRYGPPILYDTVQLISKYLNKQLFKIHTASKSFFAKYIILATGVSDIEPALPNLSNAVKQGLVRHCLVCDAYEAKHKKIAILGQGLKGLKTAYLLKAYSNHLTYFNLNGKSIFSKSTQKKCNPAKIKIIKHPIENVKMVSKKRIEISTTQETFTFDVLYSALGADVRSQLAISLGAKYSKEKNLTTNKKQETNIPGLYAIGDVTTGINQMCVAASHAVIASMDIFNKLSAL